MVGPVGEGGGDPGAGRWRAEKDMIDKQAAEEHLAHEAERIHAEEAEEMAEHAGTPPPAPKRPWWKFWG
ncbi:MAG TPA: hypothetical protein VIC58_11820 [Actinomycetota bacterium]|jgi:hypothetical protein